MIPFASEIGALLASIWSAYARPELDRASEKELRAQCDDELFDLDPKQLAEHEAVLAVLNSPVPF